MFIKPDRWLTPGDVARMLGVTKNTVNNWRRKGKGPAYTLLGEMYRYRIEDVESWVNRNTKDPSDDGMVIFFDPDDKKELVA
jgi:excisionase family DNA binding protein